MNLNRFVNFKYILVAIVFIIAFSPDAFAVKFYGINSFSGISSRVTNSIWKDDNGFFLASSKTGVNDIYYEGFDKQWSAPSVKLMVTFANILGGKFEFKTKMNDSPLSNVIDDRSMVLQLIPPFWETYWFRALLIIGISAIIVLSFLYYINRLKQELTEEKLRYFTNMAHELRTSLTLIKAPVEELSNEQNLSESGKYYLNLAIEQTKQLSNVLEFKKVDAGNEHLSMTMTDLVKLVSSRQILLDAYAKSKNIELIFVADHESYTTAVDESKMVIIIDYLVTYAIQYAHNNTQIRVDLSCNDQKWILQVIDQGTGIAQKVQRKLFKYFFRPPNAIHSMEVGSGLGLLLVQNYVAMHKGSISCYSRENVGSSFQVVIPFQSISDKPVSTHSTSKLPMLTDPVMDQLLSNESRTDCQPSKQKNVLHVEDNDELLNLMKKILDDEFKASAATEEAEAWEFISEQLPDFVVSDTMNPPIDGLEGCQIMRSTDGDSHIPLIWLTALSEKIDQLLGLDPGDDETPTKPFDMQQLVQRVKSVVRNREALKEKALNLSNGQSDEPILSNECNEQFIRKMMEVAKANISNTEFDKVAFASAMNVSASLLYKKVKALTGQSPTDFIKTLRLNHAMELLQSQQFTVTEISELCGFASIGYFSTVFRKHFGKPPTAIMD